MTDLIPTFQYDDAPAAIDFLCEAFGAERHAVHEAEGGRIAHAELKLGDGMIMLGSTPPPDDTHSFRLEPGGSSVYVVLSGDVDEHFERARTAGAEVTLPPRDTDYGSREYTVRDPEGNIWSFGSYRP